MNDVFHSQSHATPYQRLRALIALERNDLLVIFAYVTIIGVLSLAVPLAAQSLVNTIAAGVLIQPLIVLTLGVLGALSFAGILRLLKLSLLERMQQRIFARVALQLAEHLPRIEDDILTREYAPQLANRFFDVITLQKTTSKILLDGPSALLKVIVALVLMSFYTPYLLAFAVLLMLCITFIVGVLGIGGLRTSIEESKSKYRVADWLEELARCQRSFKMDAIPTFPIERADDLVLAYIRKRRAHFRVIFRQAFGNYFLQACASAGVLAIGGWLVINRQLTLGQVVAAEIVVVSALQGLEKLIQLLESGYDLLTSLDKIGHVTDFPTERESGRAVPTNADGARVECRQLRFAYEGREAVLIGLDLTLEPGEHASLVGASGVGKSTLAALLCGLHEPTQGVVQINGMDVRSASLSSLRRVVALVGDKNEIFEGTLEENILVGRHYITHESLQWAIEVACLNEELLRLPNGLRTHVVSEGRNLSRGQVQRLLIARAVVDRPQLLILDEGFTGIDEHDKLSILAELYSPRYPWTILDISHDPEIVTRAHVVHVLAQGRIVESGTPAMIQKKYNGEFARLFPSLCLRTAN
jgi:ATP-binding cassette subfamily B protein